MKKPTKHFKKRVLLEISQNSQENTCARVSFLIKLQAWPATLLKKRPWHRCFPVTFAKFLGAPFFKEHLRWLLLFVEKSDLISCVEKEHEIMSDKGFAFQDFGSIEGVNSNEIIHGF